ncbi:MAG: class I fructose-bisphosphate aldolase [Gammaproteobacteria bacterium]|nr:class I fructose-bisphosphate aldolase [Gammaproteobacteria bacterium]
MKKFIQEMERTVAELAAPGKGILAADESTGTIEKRFKSVSVPCTEDSRRDYREILFTTHGLGEFIGGVILFEETLKQTNATGVPLPQLLTEQGIVPGIKVDKGTVALPEFSGEKVTQGLDGLADRLAEYRKFGARFAKWRAVIPIGVGIPTPEGIAANAVALARYAAVCQAQGLVPIVEPEVLMDGNHDIATCARISEEVLHTVFHALHQQRITLELMLLKPNMVVPGVDCAKQATPDDVATATLACLRRTVPAAMPSINFLSGGQSEQMATANLNAMNIGTVKQPWVLSFSYGRALQAPALAAWHGDAKNRDLVQQALYKRARLNSAARQGRYTAAMEQEPTAA